MLTGTISRAVIDNRDKAWECDVCHAQPDNIAMLMRGGYVQETLCPQCYTGKHPKDPIYIDVFPEEGKRPDDRE